MSDPDYTLLKEALMLGGHVVTVEQDYADTMAEKIFRGSEKFDADSQRSLSTAHISLFDSVADLPKVIWSDGASMLKVSRGGRVNAVGGGLRTYIKGFSASSRRRLMVTIAKIRRDAPLPLFITLTYPKVFPDGKSSKRHLDVFQKRLKRAFPFSGWIWKLEPQERLAPHYHFLLWGCDLESMRKFVPDAWYAIAGGGDNNHLLWHMGLCGRGNVHCVQQVRSFRGVWSYASKYLGKKFDVTEWGNVGRYWGVVNRENIPFGEECFKVVTRAKAVEVQRYQRRFAHMKKQRGRSVTTFCDADQWVVKTSVHIKDS